MRTALEYYGTNTGGIGKDKLRAIKLWLDDLPDPSMDVREDRLWSCHVIARAVKLEWKLDNWIVVDGHFQMSQHSWLTCGEVILDTYPVASLGGPLLVDRAFWGKFYRPEFAMLSDEQRREYDQQAARLLGVAVCSPNNCHYPDCL